VSVVTGGANGIGRACALAFANRGSDVVVVDIDAMGAEAVAAEIETLGRRAVAIPADVGDQLSVETMVEHAIGWQGHVDVFLNNAGIAVGGPPHLIPVDDWDAAMRVNLWASIWSARKVIPHMLERGCGSFAAMSSPAGLRGVPMLGPYCVSKFALNGFLECLAVYCYGKGVHVQIAMPGPPVATGIIKTARVTYEDDELQEDEARDKAHRTWTMIAQPPDDLAEKVADGIEQGTFYIFHSDDTPVTTAERFGDLDAWLRQQSDELEKNASFGADPLVTSSKTASKLA
jgi:NAD(P)-dependent dehydrogenase (short-subunit alcohol dehydrogenase family)